MMIKTYRGKITSLKENQVFVFDANSTGFHGAGAAGFATFGVEGNRWREFNYNEKPYYWKGLWTEKGKTGYMEGTKGKSYGLVTVAKIASRERLHISQISENVKTFYEFAKNNPDLEFLVAQSNQKGLCGHEPEDIATAFNSFKIPPNVVFDEKFVKMFK